jgi:hypothetical protein
LDADLPARQRTTSLLRLLFGDTFAEGAFWWSNPDSHLFITSLLHMASGGRISTTANIDGLFVRRKNVKGDNEKFFVCRTTLRRLGCTDQELFELLRRMPGAAVKHRHPNAAPLIVPVPDEVADIRLPLYLSPAIFDIETLPPMCLGDQLSSSTTTTLAISGGDDFDLLEDYIDLKSAVIDEIEVESELDDIAIKPLTVDRELGASALSLSTTTTSRDIGDISDFDLLGEDGMYVESATIGEIEIEGDYDDVAVELLTVERELGAVASRVQGLLERHRDALGDAPGAGVVLMESLERMREQVSSHRIAAEDDRDSSLACDFARSFSFY